MTAFLVYEDEQFNNDLVQTEDLQTQILLEALGDKVSRTILLTLIAKSYSTGDLVRKFKMSQTSVYRKVRILHSLKLIKPVGRKALDRTAILYRSTIKEFRIVCVKGKIAVEFEMKK